MQALGIHTFQSNIIEYLSADYNGTSHPGIWTNRVTTSGEIKLTRSDLNE